MGDLRLSRSIIRKQIYFYERVENHKAIGGMFKSFKCVNFPGIPPDAGVD